jgi:hypothetical protein
MTFRIKNPTDFGAGVLFIVIGAAGSYFGRDLTMGSALQPGPGYFPAWLSWLIVLIGLIVAARSFAIDGPPIPIPEVRPVIMIIAAIVLFGYLIAKVGLVISTVGLVVVAAYARRNVALKETVIFAVLLGIGSTIVFVYGLGQPVPAWWWG